MEPPGGRDSRFQLGYSMNLLSGESPPEIYGGSLGRPSTSLQQLSPRHTMVSSACGTRGGLKSDGCYDDRGITPQHSMGFESSGVNDIHDEPYSSLQSKKSPPSNGKKTKGRVKIKMEYIENKLRRYTTFSKRKTGIMKKAYELSTLTGTQVMLLVASETGHVYTFATRKLQPMITSEAGKALIQTCLNSPDPPAGSVGDQRMSATGFEETELTYNISDEDSKINIEEFSEFEDYDDDIFDDDDEPPKKVLVSASRVSKPSQTSSTSQDSQGSSDSSSSEVKKPPHKSKASHKVPKENAEIISRINQMNKALIQSNKAKAVSAAPLSSNTVSVHPSTVSLISTASSSVSIKPVSSVNTSKPSHIAAKLPDSAKSVPLLLQTNNAMAFARVPEGMILRVIQGSQPKLVAVPLNSVLATGLAVSIVKSPDGR